MCSIGAWAGAHAAPVTGPAVLIETPASPQAGPGRARPPPVARGPSQTAARPPRHGRRGPAGSRSTARVITICPTSVHRTGQHPAAPRPPRMGTPHTSAPDVALLEPPGFLMLNYGPGTPTVTLAAHPAYGTSWEGFSPGRSDNPAAAAQGLPRGSGMQDASRVAWKPDQETAQKRLVSQSKAEGSLWPTHMKRRPPARAVRRFRRIRSRSVADRMRADPDWPRSWCSSTTTTHRLTSTGSC